MKFPGNDTLELYRSLIHKSVRRGDMDMTRRAIFSLIQEQDFEWLGKRLAVLTYEECWTYGTQLSNDPDCLTDHLLRLAGTVKNKNACGLGSLAYNLFLGDERVMNGGSDPDLQFVASAIRQPEVFWKWANEHAESQEKKTLLINATKGFADADQPWDKSFMMAAVYLAFSTEIPRTKQAEPVPSGEFPLWIVLDMHTAKGIAAITEASRQINLDPRKALWLAFYFEGAVCNEMIDSKWWEKEKIWRLKTLGLTMDEGQKMYKKLKPVLKDLLKEETENLAGKIFNIQ